MTMKRLILVVAALVTVLAIKNAIAHRKSEWQGLSESDARSKLDDRLPSRIPDDRRAAISDKVVARMRERGVLSEDPESADDPEEETIDLTAAEQNVTETVDT